MIHIRHVVPLTIFRHFFLINILRCLQILDNDNLDRDGDDLDHVGDGDVCRIIRGDGCRSKAALINARARDLRGIIREGHPPLPSLIIWQHPWPQEMIFQHVSGVCSQQFWNICFMARLIIIELSVFLCDCITKGGFKHISFSRNATYSV